MWAISQSIKRCDVALIKTRLTSPGAKQNPFCLVRAHPYVFIHPFKVAKIHYRCYHQDTL